MNRSLGVLILSLMPATVAAQARLLPPLAAPAVSSQATPQKPKVSPADDKKIEAWMVPLPEFRGYGAEPQPIDLLTALQLADAQNPEIALARERIREALAQQDRAEALWLPHLEFRPYWNRHDGQIQATTGEVITVSRSAAYGGGGPTLEVDLGHAWFGRLAARQITVAREAGASAVRNDRLLAVALTYMDLLQAAAEVQIAAEAFQNARRLLKLTESNEAVGLGAAADTARSRTEANIREREYFEAQGRVRVVGARLSQLLYLPPDLALVPMEPAVVPVTLIPGEIPLGELIAQSLTYRPELAENQAISRAAFEGWRGAKWAAAIPRLDLNFSAGGFGGGKNGFFGDFNGRSDFTAMAVWRLDNLGLGYAAERRERQSQFTQTTIRQSVLEAEVGQQVTTSATLALVRRQELAAAERAVRSARESYRLNLIRVQRAPDKARPIELLQAVQALARARLDYLQVVTDYNRAQFRLYAALGNPPLEALAHALPIPLEEPIVPRKNR